MIQHIAAPAHPEVRFEYHPETKKVYAVRLNGTHEVGMLITDSVSDHEIARLVVRGYIKGLDWQKAPQIGPVLRR